MIQNLEQHYKVLGLEPGASLEEVNQAYKDLVFIWHPDRVPQENERLVQKSVEKLQQINEARDSLRSYHRKYRKAPASSQPKPSYYPRREDYAGRDAYQNRDRYTRKNSDRAYSNNSQSKRSDAGSYRRQTYSQAAQQPREPYSTSDRYSNYSQTSSKRSADYKARQPWDYRAYYYSPKNSNNQSSSGKDGYQDFHETEKNYREASTPQSNHKRPYYKDLRGADLSGSNFKERDFAGRDLSKANLSHADLSDTFLHKIILEEANLEGANLKGANLLQANLRGANLREANLIGADLSGSDLSGADLTGAKVGFQNKIMVKITAVKLTGATLPDGSIHP